MRSCHVVFIVLFNPPGKKNVKDVREGESKRMRSLLDVFDICVSACVLVFLIILCSTRNTHPCEYCDASRTRYLTGI